MKLIMTATRPTPIPAISLLGLAAPLLVADDEAPVAVPVEVPVALDAAVPAVIDEETAAL